MATATTDLRVIRNQAQHDRQINASITASNEQRDTMLRLLQTADWLDDPMRVNLLIDCCLTLTLHEWWQAVSGKLCGVSDPSQIARKLNSAGILDTSSYRVLAKHFEKPLPQRRSQELKLIVERMINATFE